MGSIIFDKSANVPRAVLFLCGNLFKPIQEVYRQAWDLVEVERHPVVNTLLAGNDFSLSGEILLIFLHVATLDKWRIRWVRGVACVREVCRLHQVRILEEAFAITAGLVLQPAHETFVVIGVPLGCKLGLVAHSHICLRNLLQERAVHRLPVVDIVPLQNSV